MNIQTINEMCMVWAALLPVDIREVIGVGPLAPGKSQA